MPSPGRCPVMPAWMGKIIPRTPQATDPVDEIRNQLLFRLIDTSTLLIVLCIAVSFRLNGNWTDTWLQLGVVALFLATRVGLAFGLRHGESLFLGLSLGSLTIFDDGFSGHSSAWTIHIPFVLAVWLVYRRNWTRSIWFLAQAAALVVVNQTTWTPRLNGSLAHHDGFCYHVINLAATCVFCMFIVRYLQKLHAFALQEAREKGLAAEAALKARGEFLSHMSHELRTPLNAIQGFAELVLQDRSLDGQQLENIQSIRLSAEHLTHLVNDILDLARLGTGTLTLSKIGFDPASCLEETLTMLRPLAKEKGLSLVASGWNGIPRVSGDRMRWKQILLNLGANGIKFTSEGKVEFRANWTPTDDASGLLQVEVEDTGPGIAPVDQERIFERFLRGRSTENITGSGLGLAISRSLARAMGGDISLESIPKTGSIFRLAVHFETAEETDGDQTKMSLPTIRTLAGLRILIAEDNRTNVRLACQVLQRLNATYDIAVDGGEALDLLGRNRYDLVLLDIHMPVKDGFEVAMRVRDPKSPVLRKDTPILGLTADAFEETLDRAKGAGMDDCLVKPFRMAELAERILRLVR